MLLSDGEMGGFPCADTEGIHLATALGLRRRAPKPEAYGVFQAVTSQELS